MPVDIHSLKIGVVSEFYQPRVYCTCLRLFQNLRIDLRGDVQKTDEKALSRLVDETNKCTIMQDVVLVQYETISVFSQLVI